MDWLPADHLVYFLLDVVGELDLGPIEAVRAAKDQRGNKPYSARMMVALLLYAYCRGVFSSRKIARATHEDVAFRVLAAGAHPNFTRIAAFRREHLDALADLFTQILALCRRAGLVKLGHVALDGTKIQANASKHKAMSHERMVQTEMRLNAEIAQLLEQAEAADQADDAVLGEGKDEVDVPAELARREARLAVIRKARQELEDEARLARAAHLQELAAGCAERAVSGETQRQRSLNATLEKRRREEANALGRDDDDDEPPFKTGDGLTKHRPKALKDGKPHPSAQRNFTDPDSRIMCSGGEFMQGYNCQAVVDAEHQVVIAAALTNQPPDAEHLEPMLTMAISNCGQRPDHLSADKGYWSQSVEGLQRETGTDLLISVERKKSWEEDRSRTEGPPPATASPLERMRWKLRTDEGRELYSKRKTIVEPVFGQIKEVRGFRRFLLRGMHSVAAEWQLLCSTHNLLKLYRAAQAAA